MEPNSFNTIIQQHEPIGQIKRIIRLQYGDNWVKLFNRHIMLNQKLANFRSHILFLTACLREDFIPVSFHLTNRYVFVRDSDLRHVSLCIMRKELRGLRCAVMSLLDCINANLWKFRGTFSDEMYDALVHYCSFYYRLAARKIRSSKSRKLTTLRHSAHTEDVEPDVPTTTNGLYTSTEFRDSLILNKTDIDFSENEKDVLALDANTAIPKPIIQKWDQIVDIEQAIYRSNDKARIVNSTATVLRNPQIGIPHWVQTTQSLNVKMKGNECFCVNADKGNKTVIMYKADYEAQMDTKFGNTTLYKKLRMNANPLPALRVKLVAPLKQLQQALGLKFCSLVPAVERCSMPTPKGLVKIHKIGHPLRVIIPSFTLPTYYLSKVIHRMLWPFVQMLEARVTTPFNLVRELRSIDVTEETYLCSLDVTALFDNVDVDSFLVTLPDLLSSDEKLWRDAVPEFIDVSIPSILEVCTVVLRSSFFEFNGKKYEQIKGVPMGSPCSVAVSELYLGSLIKTAMDKSGISRPQLLRSFVDDLLLVLHRKLDYQPFYDRINSLAPNIKFTVEFESDNCLPFLDILITRDVDQLSTSVYRKPTHSGRYIHWNSNVPRSFHNSVLNTLRYRAQSYCSTAESLERELNEIEATLSKHRYPKHFLRKLRFPMYGPRAQPGGRRATLSYVGLPSLRIANILRDKGMNVAFRSCNTLSSMLYYKNKAKITKDHQSNLIYCVVCQCGKEYVGMTTRHLGKRMYEHRHDIASMKTLVSGLTEHLRDSGHQVESYEILDKGKRWSDLRIREGIQVAARKPELNKNDSFVINDCWAPLL